MSTISVKQLNQLCLHCVMREARGWHLRLQQTLGKRLKENSSPGSSRLLPSLCLSCHSMVVTCFSLHQACVWVGGC